MTSPKGKQRSIHMDDETFELLQALALKHKINNSSVVRMALAAYADQDQFVQRATAQRPVASSPLLAAPYGGAHVEPVPANPKHIALPDPKVSSFAVSGGKVRGKVPRNDREDDGLDV